MKKVNFFFLITALFITLSLSSCDKDDIKIIDKDIPTRVPESVDEFSLLSIEPNQLYVIRTEKEFSKYKLKETESGIDFSEYTLLVAKGITTSGISQVETELQKDNKDNYHFYVDVYLNLTAIMDKWETIILIPAIPQKAKVHFNYSEPDYYYNGNNSSNFIF